MCSSSDVYMGKCLEGKRPVKYPTGECQGENVSGRCPKGEIRNLVMLNIRAREGEGGWQLKVKERKGKGKAEGKRKVREYLTGEIK